MISNEEALEKFKNEVCLKEKEVDPNKEFYWEHLAIGFFLGLGFNITSARKLALSAKYDYGYWIEE